MLHEQLVLFPDPTPEPAPAWLEALIERHLDQAMAASRDGASDGNDTPVTA